MTRRNFAGKTVFITGAARGLGRALCHRFGEAGARIGGVDLLGNELNATREELTRSGIETACAIGDLRDERGTRDAFDVLRQALGPVDVLVANAGVTHIRRFNAGEVAAIRNVMEVNFQGAVHATAAAFDDLLARRGQIVVISSVAGYAPLAGRTGYCASKHALHGFFHTLRTELRGAGVGVLLVCPSSIATSIREPYEKSAGTAGGERHTVGSQDSPEAVAAQVVRAAARRRRFLAPGRIGKMAFWGHRFAPRLYERLMLRRIESGR